MATQVGFYFILTWVSGWGATYDCVIGKNEDDVNDASRWPVATFLLIIIDVEKGEHLISTTTKIGDVRVSVEFRLDSMGDFLCFRMGEVLPSDSSLSEAHPVHYRLSSAMKAPGDMFLKPSSSPERLRDVVIHQRVI